MNGSRDFTSKRPHLTKDERMPKCYKDVEKIIKSVQSCRNNFKTVMANSRFRGGHFKKVYNLSLNVLKYYNYIQKIIDKTGILIKEAFLRRETVSVLIYELIYGKGYLPGESKVVTIVQAYENDILKAHEDLQNNTEAYELNGIYVPRYVRVHTLKTTVAYVIKDLESYGFKQILYEDISEENYMELVKNLERGSFLVDFHFKDILVFAQDENLIDLDLYKNGHIFLQDKASYIPVHVLNPEPGSIVLDACAAPGMKSAHIASKMENKGTLIACERDTKRFEILKETLEYGSVKIAKTLCTDFKLIDPSDETYTSVEYILLDPSCSGSGMVNRMDEVTNNEDSTSKERIKKLAGFQIILLKHALKFPSVKRVVYSTCSIHEEENEYVVHEAISAFGNSFKLVPVLPELFSRGMGNYQYSEMCLRTVPTKHLTNGFFVAVFEKIDSYEYEEKYFQKRKKLKSNRDGMEKDYNPDRKLGIIQDRKMKSERAFEQEKNSYENTEFYEDESNSLNNVDNEGIRHKKVTKQEKSCEFEKFNEIVDNSLNDEDGSKDFHSNNYEDGNFENFKHKHHKKKSKKSKYLDHENTKLDKDQEMNSRYKEEQSCDLFDSFSQGDEISIIQAPTTLGMSSDLKDVLLSKKSKHKKSRKSEKSFDIPEESCELISEHKSKKKKKRKHSEISSCDIFPSEEQSILTNSDTLEVLQVSKSNDSSNNNYEHSTEFITGEDINLEASQAKKHKKKKKKKDHESSDNWNLNPLEVQNSKHSDEIENFGSPDKSDLLQKRNSQFDDESLKQSKSKKHKHKKHARKSDCVVSTENLLNSDSQTKMKETSCVDEKNTFETSSNENNILDIKRTKRKSKKDNTHECSNNSDTSFQNTDLVQEVSKNLLGDELNTVIDNVQNELPKRKKSKKHKQSKDEV